MRLTPNLQLTFDPLSINIEHPASDSRLSVGSVIVRGVVQGPSSAGLTVNGQPAFRFQNEFHALVTLGQGLQTVTARAVTPTGKVATSRISVFVESDPLFSPVVTIRVGPQAGPAPLKTRFEVEPSSTVPISKIEIDFDGNGSIDQVINGISAEINHVYQNPGVYQPTVKVSYGQGQVYTETKLIVVPDAVELEENFQVVWGDFTTVLRTGDVAGALGFLTEGARNRYGRVLTTLRNDLPSIVASFSSLRRVSVSPNIAEYAVNRTIGGRNKIFLIYFLHDQDGIWRIDSM